MQDNNSPRTLAPGTIDQVRRNIGPIDPAEALALQQKLGGEILQERTTSSSLPIKKQTAPRRDNIRASGLSSSDVASRSAALTATSNSKSTPSVNQLVSSNVKRMKTEEELPEITAQDLKLMNKLMMSPEYDIKPNYGFFSFILMISKNKEKMNKAYGEYNVKKHVDHMQAFISCIKTFIQLSPDTYKAKIATGSELKFKFLRTVGKWTLRDIKVLSLDLAERSSDLTVSMMIPFVKAVYKQLITIYYIGEQQIPALIKEIYNDITAYPDSDKKKMQNLAKQGITEWLYVYNQLIKGMYPLLMRMCSSEYVEFPKFFTVKIADILKFLGMTKFDLLLPEKKKKEQTPEDIKKEKQEKARKKLEENRHVAGIKDEVVVTGLKILEQMFPQAGFSYLEKRPDMYPYFQPLYKFPDGFNMLSPNNPLQVTIVLLKICEDLFQGCRNIDFNVKADEKLAEINDNFNEALSDWASYREDLFDKKYGDYFKGLVNSVYSQPDYINTQYGKEVLTNILWRTKYYFLPNFQFTQLILKKPQNDNPYKPLYARTDYIRTVLSTLVTRIDENAAKKGAVLGVMNPWDRYHFDLSNVVSKRMDVLLGAKKQENTSATNANLIKYTLCIVSVLDWWINNPASPAYSYDSKSIYRVSAKDGGPEFSVPERNDQNQLFAESVKKAIAARQSGTK